jgi:hypothetical protein
VACLAASRKGLAHQLDYLRLDLTDPQMHRHFKRQAEAARAFISEVVEEAVARGDVHDGTNVARLTRLVEAIILGSLFTWATYQEGRASAWMRRNLDDLLTLHATERLRRVAR